MTQPIFILSNETRIIQEVGFSGFVHSCRNLGHIVFFLLQDPFGLIQVVWQKSTLDTKTTDRLIGKKMYVLGSVRLREQKASSTTRVNNTIEIEAENCFIIDDQKRNYSLLEDIQQIASLLKEKKQEIFVHKTDYFEFGVFNFQLITKLRQFMLKASFIETFTLPNQVHSKKPVAAQELGRYFSFIHKDEQSPILEMEIHLPTFTTVGMIEVANQIVNVLLSSCGLNSLESIDIISAQQCLSSYGSIEPDFRFPFCIEDAHVLLDFPSQFAHCLCVQGIDKSPFLIGKIIDFVREQTGLNISYLILDEEFIDGPLKKYVTSSLKLSHSVLFFARCDASENSLHALGTIYHYLRKQGLLLQKSSVGKWVSQSRNMDGCDITHFSLIFNGQKIAFATFESYPHPFLNNGSIKFDLLALNPSNPKEQRGKKPERPKKNDSCFPPQRIPHLSIEELEAEIAIIDELEKEEVNTLLGLDPKETYLQEAKIQALVPTLMRFAMSPSDAIFLINLLPEKATSVFGLSEHSIFQFLWSLLGHKHVLETLSDERARNILQQICQLQIASDYKQILFFELNTLYLIKTILDSAENFEIITHTIKIILNSSPNDFSNLIDCLHKIIKNRMFEINENLSSFLLRLSRLGFSTPSFFIFFINNEKNEKSINEFSSLIRGFYYTILQNNKIDEFSVLKELNRKLKHIGINFEVSDTTYYEIIYYLFKPLNMDFSSFMSYYSKVMDRTEDISSQKIHFRGKHWDPIENCYFFGQNFNCLCIYASKNSASFFAKASAGICTGIDLALFQREDHFHLNLVMPKERRVIGNVQCYIFNNAQKRVLFIRGINPSASYLNKENVSFILNSVIETAVEIAEASHVDQLLLCPSLGIWHVESSRKEMIGAIRILSKKLPIIPLDRPFLLFHFANQDKEIHFAYQLWNRQEHQSSAHSEPNFDTSILNLALTSESLTI